MSRGGALMNRISALIKEAHRVPTPFPPSERLDGFRHSFVTNQCYP